MEKSLDNSKQSRTESRFFLYLTTLIINLLSFTVGITFAWTSPVIPKLLTEDNPLGRPISVNEISWLAPLISLGCAFGSFVGGFSVDKIGRKPTLTICAVPFVFCYIAIAFFPSIEVYYVARFALGVCVGVFFTAQPIMIGEIADDTNRGMLGCLTVAFLTTGNQFSFSVGPYVGFKTFNLLIAAFPIVFLVCFTMFVPESPTFLIRSNKYDRAKAALMKLRGGDKVTVDEELCAIMDTMETNKNGSVVEIFNTRSLRRGLTVTCGLMVLQQLTAISVVVFYMQKIFDDSNITIPSEVSTMIVGVVQIISSVSASMVVERFGRKRLMLISTYGTFLTLITLGLFFFMKEKAIVVSWLPITSLIVYIAMYNFGAGPIPLPVLTDIFPARVMSSAATFTICTCFVFSFLCSNVYPVLSASVGIAYTLWLFAGLNLIGSVVVMLYVPETKGRSSQEILNLLNK